ncbi:MAG: hypothetical protein R3268_07140 [Acidiferrobacterales bacterium]|nr:hypothetical protein [Acidiferrobacterales bacterium]
MIRQAGHGFAGAWSIAKKALYYLINSMAIALKKSNLRHQLASFQVGRIDPNVAMLQILRPVLVRAQNERRSHQQD